MGRYPRRPKEGVRSLRAGVTGCVPLEVGAGNKPVIWEEQEALLTAEPSFSPCLLTSAPAKNFLSRKLAEYFL